MSFLYLYDFQDKFQIPKFELYFSISFNAFFCKVLIFIDESIIKENEIFFKSKEAKKGDQLPKLFYIWKVYRMFCIKF